MDLAEWLRVLSCAGWVSSLCGRRPERQGEAAGRGLCGTTPAHLLLSAAPPSLCLPGSAWAPGEAPAPRREPGCLGSCLSCWTACLLPGLTAAVRGKAARFRASAGLWPVGSPLGAPGGPSALCAAAQPLLGFLGLLPAALRALWVQMFCRPCPRRLCERAGPGLPLGTDWTRAPRPPSLGFPVGRRPWGHRARALGDVLSPSPLGRVP